MDDPGSIAPDCSSFTISPNKLSWISSLTKNRLLLENEIKQEKNTLSNIRSDAHPITPLKAVIFLEYDTNRAKELVLCWVNLLSVPLSRCRGVSSVKQTVNALGCTTVSVQIHTGSYVTTSAFANMRLGLLPKKRTVNLTCKLLERQKECNQVKPAEGLSETFTLTEASSLNEAPLGPKLTLSFATPPQPWRFVETSSGLKYLSVKLCFQMF